MQKLWIVVSGLLVACVGQQEGSSEKLASAKPVAEAHAPVEKLPVIPEISFPEQAISAASFIGRTNAPAFIGKGKVLKNEVRYEWGGFTIDASPVGRFDRIAFVHNNYVADRDRAKVIAWLGGETKAIGFEDVALGVAAFDKKRWAKRKSAINSKLAMEKETNERTRLRSDMERKLLLFRIDAAVAISGKRVRVTWPLCTRVTWSDIAELLAPEMRELGATHLNCDDGFGGGAHGEL